jgi:hypothetical protein
MTHRKYLYSALLMALAGAGCSDDASEQDVEQIVRDAVVPSTKIRVSPTSGLGTDERGGSAQFLVELTSAPTDTVTIRLFSTDESEGLPSENQVVFTPDDFGPRVISVTGVDDGEADGNVRYQIVLDEAVSSDLRYQSVPASDVTLTNSDDDVPGVTVLHEDALSTGEDGTASVLRVRLNTRPSAPVRVPLASLTPSEGTVSLHELWFLPRDWDIPQEVTVEGVDDDTVDGDQPFVVALGKLESGDYDYLGLDPADIRLVNRDLDQDGVRIVLGDKTPMREDDEDTRSIEVVLTTRPESQVTIEAGSNDSYRSEISEALTFSPDNWDVPQSFTVHTIDNDYLDGDSPVTFYFYATSDDVSYSSLNFEDIEITVLEDDRARIHVDTWSTSTCETDAEFCCSSAVVSLNGWVVSGASVTLSAEVSDASEGKLDLAELTFDEFVSGSQYIKVCGVDDSEVDGAQDFTLTLALKHTSDPRFEELEPAELVFTNQDHDFVEPPPP